LKREPEKNRGEKSKPKRMQKKVHGVAIYVGPKVRLGVKMTQLTREGVELLAWGDC